MQYPRAPRFYHPRFSCLGFLFIGWIYYSFVAGIITLWYLSWVCIAALELFLWCVRIIDRYNKRRKNLRYTRRY